VLLLIKKKSLHIFPLQCNEFGAKHLPFPREKRFTGEEKAALIQSVNSLIKLYLMSKLNSFRTLL